MDHQEYEAENDPDQIQSQKNFWGAEPVYPD